MNQENHTSSSQLWKYFLLAFSLSWILWLPGLFLTYGLVDPTKTLNTISSVLQWIGGIGPSAAALILIFKEDGKTGIRRIFKRAFQVKLGYWYLPIFLILPMTVLLAQGLNVAFFGGVFPRSGILSEPWWIPVLFLTFLILQFSEELGWRGYAMDRLQKKWGALGSSLALGSIWAIWHVPMFLSSGFGQHDNQLPYGQFFITIVLVSVLITWLQNNTRGSLVPAFVMHALFALVGEVLPLIEKLPDGTNDYTAWMITNGLLLIVVVAVVSIWGSRKLAKSNRDGS